MADKTETPTEPVETGPTNVNEAAGPVERYASVSSSDEPTAAPEKMVTESTETEETAEPTDVEETEEAGDEDVEETEEAGDEDAEEAEDEAAPKKKNKSFQERINELSRARREAERRAAEAEERAVAAERKAVAENRPEATTEGPPDPAAFKYGEIDPEYIAALVDYRSDLRDRTREEARKAAQADEQRARQEQEINTKFQAAVVEGRKKHADFADVIALAEAEQKFAFSPEIGVLIVSSPQNVDLIYHLASNPDEAAGIAAKSLLEQARELGRLETRFARQQSAGRKVSKAPEPVPTVKGSSSAASPDIEKMNGEEYLTYLQSRTKKRA